MRCPRCHTTDLTDDGVMASWRCATCEGGFLAEADATELLQHKLGHSREELLEIASLFGGERITCPSCRSRMSPISLRGVDVDVCFGCGGAWFDTDELARVREASQANAARASGAALAPLKSSTSPTGTQVLVRFDERSAARQVTRRLFAAVGGAGVALSVLGVGGVGVATLSSAALVGAVLLSRHRALDVLPRARRVVRWRGFLPPSFQKGDGAAFSPESCVVVRRHHIAGKVMPWVVIDLVDEFGRDMARIAQPLSLQRAWTRAPQLARALGISVRFDVDSDTLDADDAARVDNAVHRTWRASAWRVEHEVGTAGKINVFAAGDGGEDTLLASALLAEPSVFTFDGKRMYNFTLTDSAMRKLTTSVSTEKRRTTVLLADARGVSLGHLDVRSGWLGHAMAWVGPQGKRSVIANVSVDDAVTALSDGFERVRGKVAGMNQLPFRTLQVQLDDNAWPAEARLGLAALLVCLSTTFFGIKLRDKPLAM